MKRLFTTGLTTILLFSISLAQTPVPSTPPQQDPLPDDVVRISTSLVQTDLVVTDKDGKAITDLKLDEFKVTENGKRQDVKFMEFVDVDAGPRPPRRPEDHGRGEHRDRFGSSQRPGVVYRA